VQGEGLFEGGKDHGSGAKGEYHGIGKMLGSLGFHIVGWP
jgi:hypothetical protein